jgi:hypothetical protein
MITVVVIFNLLLAIACLYVARRIWQLKFALAKATDALVSAEQATTRMLSPTPGAMSLVGDRCIEVRQRYQDVELRLLRVQKLLALLGMTRWVWQIYGKRSKHLQQLTPTPPQTKRDRRKITG